MVKCYDVYLLGDSSLSLVRFPQIKSKFDSPASQIQMNIRPISFKIKLEVATDPRVSNIYTSSTTNIDDGQLYACKMLDDSLICRPVSNLLTFRPDLSHMNPKEEPKDTQEEIRPVSVKLSGPERHNPSTRSRVDDTEDPLDEPKTLTYASLASRDSIQQRQTLFARIKTDPDRKPDIKPKIPAPSPKKSFAISQLVKNCLLKAKLVSFEEVYQMVDQLDRTKDILDTLADLAILVQGNWVVKSEVLYGDSSERDCSDVTGISIRLFIAARDYLMWLFQQDRYVSRLSFTRAVKIPDEDALELMNQLGTLDECSKKWEFKLPTDKSFIDKFPEVVQRQAKLWKVRRANKLAIFG